VTSEAQAKLDAAMMRRALSCAARGDPSPNPHVGAVVARGARVVSVGHHARCGGPHAEVVALEKAGRRARGATLYVTFEPCNHHGRTPPCTEAIIASGVKRVVFGCKDPLPHVPGSKRRLERAGIEVMEIGTHAERTRARRLIADFAKHRRTGMPEVTLKAAITLDGRTATRSGDSKWITSESARKQAHRMRAYCDAVLVGVGTVLADDPELTVRALRGRSPLRVVLDSRLRTPLDAKVVRTARDTPTLIFHGPRAPAARAAKLRALGVELQALPLQGTRLSLPRMLEVLGGRGVVRLLVEGGAHVHGALLDAGQVDRVALFIAPKLLGDPQAMPLAVGQKRMRIAQALTVSAVETVRLGDDLLILGDLKGPRAT
jgi:diaminohydroxyphosphoribosylaminopyrimidine deaminase/5-amino-6-(5-phosphoribosylamino)uracil reductase